MCLCVFEKKRYVSDVLNIYIIHYSRVVIKMEGIIKMIGIGEPKHCDTKNTEDNEKGFMFFHFYTLGERCMQNSKPEPENCQ